MSAWWKKTVFYEILVHSFQDSNADGVGDLNGIAQRLDYLVKLGIGAIWLSPITKTANFDMGYDVIDYCAVDPMFGTLDDFKRLLNEAHQRKVHVIVDYVPNHTSNQHPWFLQSRASKDNPYRDFYIWSDPASNGGPPNNWINRFGESGWTFDEATEQYYFGTFAPEQPDLNWRNPGVQREMLNVLRFWLDIGCDGFRVDALPHLIKDQRLRRNPPDLSYTEEQDPSNRLLRLYSENQPELLGVIGLVKQLISEFPDRVFVAEAFKPLEQIATYQRSGVDLVLNTSMLQSKFEQVPLQVCIDRAEVLTPPECWPSHMSGDHDLKRLASRFSGKDLRVAALLQFTIRGTPTMYYGEELGLAEAYVPKEALVDPSGKSDERYGRDSRRLPMPWSDEANAGFSQVEPWLPLDDATRAKHVAKQAADPESLLNFYRRLITFRNASEILQLGDYTPLDASEHVLAFWRGSQRDGLLVAVNFSDRTINWPFEEQVVEVLLSTRALNPTQTPGILRIEPREGVIVRLPEMPT